MQKKKQSKIAKELRSLLVSRNKHVSYTSIAGPTGLSGSGDSVKATSGSVSVVP